MLWKNNGRFPNPNERNEILLEIEISDFIRFKTASHSNSCHSDGSRLLKYNFSARSLRLSEKYVEIYKQVPDLPLKPETVSTSLRRITLLIIHEHHLTHLSVCKFPMSVQRPKDSWESAWDKLTVCSHSCRLAYWEQRNVSMRDHVLLAGQHRYNPQYYPTTAIMGGQAGKDHRTNWWKEQTALRQCSLI